MSKLTNDMITWWKRHGDGGQLLTTPKSLTDIGIEDRSTLRPHGVHGTPSEARLLLPISKFVVAVAYPSSALHLCFSGTQ
jgi:hypothetical protein